jgi:hypothetical protein
MSPPAYRRIAATFQGRQQQSPLRNLTIWALKCPAKLGREEQMTTGRTKAEIAACVAEILTALARMARDQKLGELHMMIETATKQAQYDATSESKKSSRKRSAA